MKKETFKQVLFSAALLASVFEVQAQDNPITFTRDMTFRENYGWANSMCTPKIGDFDNDGVNDLWLDGQRQSYSWQTRTVFAKGLGERTFQADFEPIMETELDSTIVQKTDTIWKTDESGDFVLDGEGNKIVEEIIPVVDDEGKPVNDTIVTKNEVYVGTQNGLPQTAWSVGSQPIDFNADGLWNVKEESQHTREITNGDTENDVNTFNKNNGTLYATKLIVSYPLWKGNLSFGGEYSHTSRTNLYHNQEGILDNDDSKIKEGSTAVFMDYSHSFGKVDVQAGVRYENVKFDYYEQGKHIDEQSRTFNNVFPSDQHKLPHRKNTNSAEL